MCRTLDGVAFEARGVLPSRRLMGMCRTLDGVAFSQLGYIDYNGVTFLVVTRMGSQILGISGI